MSPWDSSPVTIQNPATITMTMITPKKKAASTLRLGVPENGTFAIFAHCQSSVISDYVALFPDQDRVEGNRAILFDTADQIDPKRHGLLIKSALTYHL